jgi:hypothetical protein
MKKFLMLGVLALMVGSAQAAEQGSVQPRELFRYDFRCEFKKDNGPDFLAMARVFADNNYDQSTRDNLTNLIAVTADDSLIAANSATLTSGQHVVVISDANGSPSIVVKRDSTRGAGPEWMKYDAWLAFDSNHKIPGSCEVRAQPANPDHG